MALAESVIQSLLAGCWMAADRLGVTALGGVAALEGVAALQGEVKPSCSCGRDAGSTCAAEELGRACRRYERASNASQSRVVSPPSSALLTVFRMSSCTSWIRSDSESNSALLTVWCVPACAWICSSRLDSLLVSSAFSALSSLSMRATSERRRASRPVKALVAASSAAVAAACCWEFTTSPCADCGGDRWSRRLSNVAC